MFEEFGEFEEIEEYFDCKYCNTTIEWEAGHDTKGDIWICESCEDPFCSQCFTERNDVKLPPNHDDLPEYDDVFCIECKKKKGLMK